MILVWTNRLGANVPTIDSAFDSPSCELERRLFLDAADGELNEFQPLGAALIAGGVADVDDLHRYQQKAASLTLKLRRIVDMSQDPRDRAEAVLSFLHRRVFCRGYDLAYTDVRRVLDEGRFNCVSATVLFKYFAGELGLPCRGLEMPGHAAARVLLARGSFDVETTCPVWFRPDVPSRVHPPLATAAIGNAASVERSKAREVSEVQLVAMIYYNRGVDLMAQKRFADAAAANAKAVRLDPHNATARGNLLAAINNWSIELGNRGEYAEAVALLRSGLAMDANFQPFAQNYVHVHRQWIELLCRRGEMEKAKDVLSQAIAEVRDSQTLRQLQSELRHRSGNK